MVPAVCTIRSPAVWASVPVCTATVTQQGKRHCALHAKPTGSALGTRVPSVSPGQSQSQGCTDPRGQKGNAAFCQKREVGYARDQQCHCRVTGQRAGDTSCQGAGTTPCRGMSDGDRGGALALYQGRPLGLQIRFGVQPTPVSPATFTAAQHLGSRLWLVPSEPLTQSQ